ncbi:hypothetical protein T484DRAFT_1826410 [Baffinella frigidus]|nr:hypothetical protein T484DRAFT_1826410 [Cryptophyta sp. CCMP2293]
MSDVDSEEEAALARPSREMNKAESDKHRTEQNAEIKADMENRVQKRLEFIANQTDLLMHFEPKGAGYQKADEADVKNKKGRLSVNPTP